jgi:LmbE family N-acetylglucosaminyl deacetylase
MAENLKLLVVLAHPDDESLGAGGTLLKYAHEGVETHLITPTRGERGWFGPAHENPGLKKLGERREQELRCAADVLSVRQVHLLDYIDGDVDQADAKEIIAQIAPRTARRTASPNCITWSAPPPKPGSIKTSLAIS